jgi:hypothetical protein
MQDSCGVTCHYQRACGRGISVDRVDLSSLRNSCVAAISEYGHASKVFRVVDLLSNEVLFGGFCATREGTGVPYCGGGRDIALLAESDAAFATALK